MKNKNHNWSIIEYLDRLSVYDQEVLLYDGERTAIGMLSCGKIVDISNIELKNYENRISKIEC